MNHANFKTPQKKEILSLKLILHSHTKTPKPQTVSSLQTKFRKELITMTDFYSVIAITKCIQECKKNLNTSYQKFIAIKVRDKIFYYAKPSKKFSKSMLQDKKINFNIPSEALYNLEHCLTTTQRHAYLTNISYDLHAKKLTYALRKIYKILFQKIPAQYTKYLQ
ncbi:hypothetical protein CRPAC_p080 (plastid) [Cryptomonas paramecium]|uniref:Uncharacterized protein n=1 Tax=Cryptomonas paramaecium TaxID=2898 RepID=D2ISE0_9CRYP|nr:hypothetical protein CRPAC_p080 [Cryptomonas paramecium]ACT46832.1 hypothetical protein CRPAC_p080 [Cryptomonas paramecium]BDA98046.1 hypothetical protein [Cryptomonas paramecium]